MIEAVVFDLDGVLIETEELWDEVREALAREAGARYDAAAPRAMMGMSAPEWSAIMERLGVPGPAAAINDEVVRRLSDRYRERLPLIPVAVEDSHAGIRSARAAGLRVLAVPNHSYPQGAEALALADLVLADLAALTPEAVEGGT